MERRRGGAPVLSLDTGDELRAQHGDVTRRVDPNAHRLAAHAEHDDTNVVADDDPLVYSAL